MKDPKNKSARIASLIVVSLVTVPVLLFMCSETGMMLMHAVSENSAHQRAFQREVCGDNEQRQTQIKVLTDSRVWGFRQSIENRPSETRVEVGASDRFLSEILGSDGSEKATSELRSLYWYEYCRDNNPVIDVYDQQLDSLVAVYRSGTHRRGIDREWYDYVYDCRRLDRAERVIGELIALGFWEKVEPIDEDWRGNRHLKVYELEKFHPEMSHDLSFEERGDIGQIRSRYRSAVILWGICNGYYHKLQIGEPQGGLSGTIEKHPSSIRSDIEKIEGIPNW